VSLLLDEGLTLATRDQHIPKYDVQTLPVYWVVPETRAGFIQPGHPARQSPA
jgi:hypothetical protein